MRVTAILSWVVPSILVLYAPLVDSSYVSDSFTETEETLPLWARDGIVPSDDSEQGNIQLARDPSSIIRVDKVDTTANPLAADKENDQVHKKHSLKQHLRYYELLGLKHDDSDSDSTDLDVDTSEYEDSEADFYSDSEFDLALVTTNLHARRSSIVEAREVELPNGQHLDLPGALAGQHLNPEILNQYLAINVLNNEQSNVEGETDPNKPVRPLYTNRSVPTCERKHTHWKTQRRWSIQYYGDREASGKQCGISVLSALRSKWQCRWPQSWTCVATGLIGEDQVKVGFRTTIFCGDQQVHDAVLQATGVDVWCEHK